MTTPLNNGYKTEQKINKETKDLNQLYVKDKIAQKK